MSIFQDRTDAGRLLAESIKCYSNQKDTLILALPRGGVPIASELSYALNIPFDVFLVRKLGTPGNSELAMGAIALGGVAVFNDSIIQSLNIDDEAIQQVIDKEDKELQRRNQIYRQGRALPSLKNKTVILVDDGVATGATIKAAIKAIKALGAGVLIIAVPVGAEEVITELHAMVDDVYCLAMPEPLYAIGAHYDDFPQVTDEEVLEQLKGNEKN